MKGTVSKIVRLLSGVLVVVFLALLTLAPLSAGAEHGDGTSDVTLNASVVGDATRFIVTVVNKEQRPVSDVSVSLVAEHLSQQPSAHDQHGGSSRLSVQARPSGNAGEYVANLRISRDGPWKITVVHGQDQTEYGLMGTGEPVRLTAGDHTSAPPPNQGDTKTASTSTTSQTEPAVRIDRTIGAYALTFTLDKHPHPGEESALALEVTDPQSSRPVSGLNVELIPVRLVASPADGHGDGDHETSAAENEDAAIPAIQAAEHAGSPGRYEAKYTFADAGEHLVLVRLGDGQQRVIPMPVGVESEHHDASSQPNYWFVGSVLGIIAVTIGMVVVLRQRDLAVEPVKARRP